METRTIYDKNGITIRVDKYNWLLIMNGDYRNPLFFGTLGNLFTEVLESKLKAKLKKDFKNLEPLLKSVLEKIKNIADSIKKPMEGDSNQKL